MYSFKQQNIQHTTCNKRKHFHFIVKQENNKVFIFQFKPINGDRRKKCMVKTFLSFSLLPFRTYHFRINISFLNDIEDLKWYYAQFSSQKLGYNCYIVQKIAINNDCPTLFYILKVKCITIFQFTYIFILQLY